VGSAPSGDAAGQSVPAPRLAERVVAQLQRGRSSRAGRSQKRRAGRGRCASNGATGCGSRTLWVVPSPRSAISFSPITWIPGWERARRTCRGTERLCDLSGIDASSRLVAALGPNRLRLVETVGSPVLDLSPGGSRCTERRPTRRSAISTSAAGASSRCSADSKSALRAPKTSSSRRSRNPFASTRFAGKAAATGQACHPSGDAVSARRGRPTCRTRRAQNRDLKGRWPGAPAAPLAWPAPIATPQ
jgi:hypothetical protein